MSSDIGSRMRPLRAARGWSQADLAAAMDVSLRTIGTWERTQVVPPHQLHRLAEVLGDPPDEVIPEDTVTLQYKGFTVHIRRNDGATDDEVRAAIPGILAALDDAADTEISS